jgi:hypothetical protein
MGFRQGHPPIQALATNCADDSFADRINITSSTTSYPADESGWFTITHPFHPLHGTRYQLLERRFTWSCDRVFYFDHTGTQRSFATNLTNVLPPDAFVAASAGRSAFRVEDLLALREELDRHLSTAEGTDHV